MLLRAIWGPPLCFVWTLHIITKYDGLKPNKKFKKIHKIT